MEDIDIEIIKAKKMRELRKRLQEGTLDKKEKSDRSILLDYLTDRGDEVLRAAEEQYPAQMRLIIPRLAAILRRGEVQSKISGADLLSILRTIGLNVKIGVSIKYSEHGKSYSIAEKLRDED